MIRSVAGMGGLFGSLVSLMLAMKLLFLAANWSEMSATDAGGIIRALLIGLWFDFTTAALLLLPVFIAWCLLLLADARLLRWFASGYVTIVAFLVPAVAIADLQYFFESGKHFTYELLVYLGPSGLPMIVGAFTLHPWLLSFALAACLGFAAAAGYATRRLVASCIPCTGPRLRAWPPNLPILAVPVVAMALGGTGMTYLDIGHSVISPDPYANALCLNPAYAILRTSFSSEKPYRHGTEERNIRTTRALLGCDGDALDPRYPMLRESPGASKPNGMNVVLVILESWSGSDIGCLGGQANVTPFFDDLARQGTLFTNAYATGIRTSEGVFSMLCSFPNQPVLPIMKRTSVLQNRWRSLSQILAEVGYHNIFVHGRDLDFDHLASFLRAINFQTIISRDEFSPSASATNGAWRGFHDEDVMRRADAEFAAENGRPFFGVIYTMNTHPPFITPDGFPLVRQPNTDADRYLNALRYSDYTLSVLLELARSRPYFKNTVFIFVADHARTRGRFNLSNQHHIPLLVYSPGHVPARVNPAVASQTDILPTVLGLLNLKARHASWGRNLMTIAEDEGFAVCIVGDEVRWRNRFNLLSDRLSDARALLFDVVQDPTCTRDVWQKTPQTGEDLKDQVRSYLSLSQTLLYENRVYP